MRNAMGNQPRYLPTLAYSRAGAAGLMWSFRRLSIWSEPRKLRLRSFSVPRRDQMNSHKNALLTPRGREPMVRAVVDGGLSKATVAGLYKTTPKTVAKWVGRFRV